MNFQNHFDRKKFPQNRLTRTPKIFKTKKYWTGMIFVWKKNSTKPSDSYPRNWIFGECVEKKSTKPSESYPEFAEKIPQFANKG